MEEERFEPDPARRLYVMLSCAGYLGWLGVVLGWPLVSDPPNGLFQVATFIANLAIALAGLGYSYVELSSSKTQISVDAEQLTKVNGSLTEAVAWSELTDIEVFGRRAEIWKLRSKNGQVVTFNIWALRDRNRLKSLLEAKRRSLPHISAGTFTFHLRRAMWIVVAFGVSLCGLALWLSDGNRISSLGQADIYEMWALGACVLLFGIWGAFYRVILKNDAITIVNMFVPRTIEFTDILEVSELEPGSDPQTLLGDRIHLRTPKGTTIIRSALDGYWSIRDRIVDVVPPDRIRMQPRAAQSNRRF